MTLKTVLIPLLSMIVVFTAHGQKIDSLKSLLQQKKGAEKADVLFELARQYFRSNQDSTALQAGLEGYKIAIDLNDSLRIVKTGRVTANALRRLEKVDSALAIYKNILPLCLKLNYSYEYPVILSGMGLAYTWKAEYDKALEFFFKSLEEEKREHDEVSESITLNNIGVIYYKLKNYRKGQMFFEEAVALKRKIDSNYDLHIAYINLGLCHAYLGDFSKAKSNIQLGIKACEGECPDYVLRNADFALGYVSFGLKEYKKAENFFLRSFAMSKKTHDIRHQFDNIDYLTQIYLHQNRIRDAAHYLRIAEALIHEGTFYNLEIIKIYSRFIELYNKTKDYKKAAFYQQRYIQLKDSTYNEELTNKLMKVEADYLERENKAKIESQEQILHLKEAVINRQQLLNILACCLAVALALLAILLIRSNRRKQMINTILDERVRERTRQLEENHKILMGALNERNVSMEKASDQVRKTLASIKGLCEVGLLDINDPVATRRCIDGVMVMSDQLASGLRHFQESTGAGSDKER